MKKVILIAGAAGLCIAGLTLGSFFAGFLPDRVAPRPAGDRRLPIGILGDSDSQGYADSLWFPAGSASRGGPWRKITSQWTEILAELRPAEVDLGDEGIWGGRSLIVRLLEGLGFRRRAPIKKDRQYNLAFAGARCRELVDGPWRQAQRLIDIMDKEPERWSRGLVVIRIGIIDLGGKPMLDAMARDPDLAQVVKATESCLASISRAANLLRASHPSTRLLFVGILNNADSPDKLQFWRSAGETANIQAALDRFDAGLRNLARSVPPAAFFDDRAWSKERWGSRDAQGLPDYHALKVGDTITVSHAMGDDPLNSILSDGHAGLVLNALWCASLTQAISSSLGMPVAPITAQEIQRFLANRLALTPP